MDKEPENKVPSRRQYKFWLIVGLVVFVIAAAAGLFFYFLVKDNLESLKSAENAAATANLHLATADDPSAGNPEAEIVIVQFADFQCPACYQSFPAVRQIIDRYEDEIKFIFRDFPLPEHEFAQKAAEAAECAHEQGKFWEMHDKIFINQDDLSAAALKKYAGEIGLNQNSFDQCLDSRRYQLEVEEDLLDGLEAGVSGTPTFFINNRKFTGAFSAEDFMIIIDPLIEIYK